MTAIEITTTQNVTIEYTLSGYGRRVAAYFIDLIVMTAWFVLHIVLLSNTQLDGNSYNNYLLFIVMPFIIFYTLAMEFFLDGQTPGKRLVGIKVMTLMGEETSFIHFFTRWVFRFIEIYFSLGVLASIMINTSFYKQRLADVIAGTVLVRVKSDREISVSDLIKITNKESFTALYPEVLQFREKDVLLIKKMVDSYESIHNKAHKDLLIDAAENIAKKLNLHVQFQDDHEKFLRQLIKEYVVLSR